MTNTLKWRLGKLPTSDEVLKLVNDKIITKEEARDILFNEEVETERDIESYKQEIKFLKQVIDKLGDREKIVTVVKEYVPHYNVYPFYQPYWNYATCGTFTTTSACLIDTSVTASGNTAYLTNCSGSGSGSINCSYGSTSGLSDVNTF